MEEQPIEDIPQFKKLRENAEGLHSINAAMPILGPLFNLLGANVKDMKKALNQTENLTLRAKELTTIPDRFNDCFAEKGWIMYDSMNFEVAKNAVQKAEAGDIDGAEEDLVNYYDADTIEFQIQGMKMVTAFQPRWRLAQLALLDYRETRYHACVPVVLALLDGLVNELHKQRRGFFSNEVDLQAWDSISVHNKGLNALVKIFQKGRYKTTTDQISIPYRNGIIHGMDLGYDNKVVAAKSWAALFATRDWAIKSEQGLLDPQPEEPKTTWPELLEQHKNLEHTKALLLAWEPRILNVGVDIPTSGEPTDYANSSPEQSFAQFLKFWKVKNYGGMAKSYPSAFKNQRPINHLAGDIKDVYTSRTLTKYVFEEIVDKAPSLTTIKIHLWYEENDEHKESTITARLICENGQDRGAIRDQPGTFWTINNWELLY